MNEGCKDLIDGKLAVIEQKIEEINAKLESIHTAFMLDDLGRPGFENHRQYHLNQTKRAKEFDNIRVDVTKRILQTLATAIGVGMWFGALYWIQQNLAK